MSDFILKYEDLESITEYAKFIGKQAEEYGESLESKILNAMDEVTGSSSGYLNSASDSVKDKIKELKLKSQDFYHFAKQVTNLLEVAEQMDQEVADIITAQKEVFLNHHESLRIADWKAKLLSLFVDIKNSLPLLSEIADILDGLGTIFESLKDSIKHWYECEGGKQAVNTVSNKNKAYYASAACVSTQVYDNIKNASKDKYKATYAGQANKPLSSKGYTYSSSVTNAYPSGNKRNKYKDDYFIDENFRKSIYCTLGSRGSYVYDLEKKLAALGILCGPVDGIYDYNTYLAIQKYQREHHIYPSGIVEQKTMAYILADYRYETTKNNIPENQREAYKNNLEGAASTVSYKVPGRSGESIDVDKMYLNMFKEGFKIVLDFSPFGVYNDGRDLFNDIKKYDGSKEAGFNIALDLICLLPMGDAAKDAKKTADVVDGIHDAEKTVDRIEDTVKDVKKSSKDIVEGSRTGGKATTILKETDTYIDYLNDAGEKIRIPKQASKTIEDSITKNLNSTNVGTNTEAEVANYIKNNTNEEITDYANKVKDSSGQVIGDIDCATKNELIEVKSSISSVKVKQFGKYIDSSNVNYLNVNNKKVILYIKEPIDMTNPTNIAKLKELKEMGVTIVNGLDELKGVIH